MRVAPTVSAVRQTPLIATEPPTSTSGAVAGASISRRTPSSPPVDGDDRSDLAHDAREHGLRLPPRAARYGSRRYASTSRSSPTGRVEAWSSSLGARELAEEARPVARQGRRDEDEQLVDEPGLEERRRERRPALEQDRLHALGRERRELLLERPRAQLELGARRQRPAAEREPARLPGDRDISRVEPRRIGPHRPHPDRDRIERGAQLVHEPP